MQTFGLKLTFVETVVSFCTLHIKQYSGNTFYCFSGCDDGKRFVCKTCGAAYKHPESLSRHKHACGNIKKFCCPFCPYRSNRNDTLKLHVINMHREQTNYVQPTTNKIWRNWHFYFFPIRFCFYLPTASSATDHGTIQIGVAARCTLYFFYEVDTHKS